MGTMCFRRAAAYAFVFLLLSLVLIYYAYRRVWSENVGIWAAVEREDIEGIKQYSANGGDLEVGAIIKGKTPLLHALKHGKKNSYRVLLELGASPNTRCRGGAVVIHHAAAAQDDYWLRLALEAGGDPNLFNDRGRGSAKARPLSFAIANGVLENVKLLVRHGADINAPDLHNRTPLTQACDAAEFHIVLFLLESGADFANGAPQGFTFIDSLKQKRPESYRHYPDGEERWCRAVYDWLRLHGADPANAKWDGLKWRFECE